MWQVRIVPVTGSSQTYPLFIRALSLYGITKQVQKYRFLFLIVKRYISRYTIYLLNGILDYLFIYLIFIVTSKKACPFLFLGIFVFSQTSILVFTFHKSSLFGGKYLCRPLSNMVPVKKKLSFITFSFYQIIFSKALPKSHNFNTWQKYYLLYYGKKNRLGSKTWKKEQKQT